MKIEAMIDRFSDQDTAVILAEEIGKEFVVKQDQLPDGAERGDYLVLELEGNEILSIEKDEETTKERKASIKSKLDQLRKGKTQSRFRK